MITCRDQKLYFSTTLGLFPVSSIDYTTKTLTISHPSCSSSRYYVSPSLLSAGFPTPPQPNSLLLFSCSNQNHPPTASLHNCTSFNTCASSPYKTDQDHKLLGAPFSCLIISDLEKLGKSFHPKDLKCSHYLWLHRVLPSKDEGSKGYELGTRISFDIPDHLPNLCDECEKPNGNCGIGLRCICHPQACKDKIISLAAGSVKASGNFHLSLLSFTLVLVSILNS